MFSLACNWKQKKTSFLIYTHNGLYRENLGNFWSGVMQQQQNGDRGFLSFYQYCYRIFAITLTLLYAYIPASSPPLLSKYHQAPHITANGIIAYTQVAQGAIVLLLRLSPHRTQLNGGGTHNVLLLCTSTTKWHCQQTRRNIYCNVICVMCKCNVYIYIHTYIFVRVCFLRFNRAILFITFQLITRVAYLHYNITPIDNGFRVFVK